MHVEKTILNPSLQQDNGLYVISSKDIPLPNGFDRKDYDFVYIPPGETAGNHQHRRIEIFICMDEGAELHWVDPDTHEKHVEDMAQEQGQVKVFTIGSMVPHAVVNRSSKGITLIEFMNEPHGAIESVSVV